MRLKRRNLICGYIKVVEFTESGLKHLHILYRGEFIAKWYISKVWESVHKAPIVFIKETYGAKSGKANYMAKYMTKQGAGRYSWSWDWVYKGFVGTWFLAKREFNRLPPPLKAKSHSFKAFMDLWRYHLKRSLSQDVFLGFLHEMLDKVCYSYYVDRKLCFK